MSDDNDKRAAQTTLPENIRELYQQILSEGSILAAGGESLTQQIVQERFPEIAPEIQREIQREIDIEPRR